VRNGKERTFATLGLAWRVAKLISAPQSLAQRWFPDKRYRRKNVTGFGLVREQTARDAEYGEQRRGPKSPL